MKRILSSICITFVLVFLTQGVIANASILEPYNFIIETKDADNILQSTPHCPVHGQYHEPIEYFNTAILWDDPYDGLVPGKDANALYDGFHFKCECGAEIYWAARIDHLHSNNAYWYSAYDTYFKAIVQKVYYVIPKQANGTYGYNLTTDEYPPYWTLKTPNYIIKTQ